MSFDQPRHHAGSPAGGQFAATTRRETGLSLVPDDGLPVRDILGEELAAQREHVALLEATELVLREQHSDALEARRTVTTTREARAVGGDIAELDFLRDTVAMETEVARHDVAVLRTRIALDEDPQRVLDDVARLRGSADARQLEQVVPMLTALDAEVDAGRMDSHPWRDPRRDELVADLTASLQATPRHPAARAWKEQLAVLADPMRVRRLSVPARNGDAAAEVQMEKARRAQAAVVAHLNGERPSTPRLRVV